MVKNNSSETDVVVKIISPFLKKLGYDENKKGEIEYEKTIPIGRNKFVYPDAVVSINGIPAIVIDAKNPTENIDLYTRQILSYGLLLKTPYSVITNGIILRIYETYTEKVIWEKLIERIPDFLLKNNLLKKIKKSVETVSEEKLEEAKKTLLVFEGIAELSIVLSNCEDIIRDIDGLTGADAFDEISKILFTKMYFEKMAVNTGKTLFSAENIKQNGGSEYVKTYLFNTARDNNKDIFIGDEKIELDDQSIEKIVNILQDYALVKTDVDVKGRAFEIFLGRTFTGKLGQFFTPRTIVTFAVLFADPEITSILSKSNQPYLVVDPACGSGGFLIEVFKAIHDKIKKLPENKRANFTEKLSKEQIYGVDISARLVRVAKMNMVLHGDGHGGIYKNNGLEDINEIEENKFDLVITNPPFGNKDVKKELLKKFDLGKKDGNVLPEQLREILFVERCIELLKKGGELAILLPDGILNNEQLDYVRAFIKSETIIKAVISLPDRAFKATGANSKTSLLFLKRKMLEAEEQPPIFMGVAEYVGYETKTIDAKSIEANDLPKILQAYRDFKLSKMAEHTKKDKDTFAILRNAPACFVIGEDLLSSRIDATYYYAKLVFELDIESCRVNDVAKLSRIIVNPQKEPTKTIRYIQYSHIEKNLGDIPSHFELLGETAPSRAKLFVNTGDVLCAKVKDSEENVAMVPRELEGSIVSTGFVVLKPKPPMTPEALFALLRLKTTTNQVRWKSSGTILPAISDSEYMSIKIPKLNKAEIDKITKEIGEVNIQRSLIKEKLNRLSDKLK